MLALRHATRLRSEFNGDVKYSRHDKSGRFSKRGQNYTFIVTPRPRKMWRIVIGYPYLVKHIGSRKAKNQSPDQRTMKAFYYAKTKEEVKKQLRRLRAEARQQIAKLGPKSFIAENKKHRLYRKVNVAVSRVEYDIRKIGSTEFLDD